MSKPRATRDHAPLVRCLFDIEAQHHAGGWRTDGDFHAIYTLHRRERQALRAWPLPLDPGARSGPFREVIEAMTAMFHHPQTGPALSTATPTGIVGLAACSEAWMVTRDDVGGPGMQLAENPGLLT